MMSPFRPTGIGSRGEQPQKKNSVLARSIPID
jgi:hypothetical protein